MSSQEPQAWQPAPQPPPPPPPAPSGLMRNPVVPGATMALLGGVLIVLGSFLPWLTATAPLVGTISRNGMEGGDGIITLILGVVTILIGVTQTHRDQPADVGATIHHRHWCHHRDRRNHQLPQRPAAH
jgi:hypothetical protein